MTKKKSNSKKSATKKKTPQPQLPPNLQVASLGGYALIVLKEMFFKIVATAQDVGDGKMVWEHPREMLIAHSDIKYIAHIEANQFYLVTADSGFYFKLSEGAKFHELQKVNAKG